jgi:serine/threonine protein phosphatase 1
MNTQPLSLVRALSANHAGRDFVVGDLHGCFDLLDRLLEAVRFDAGCDRLFSVGGLVDYGPDSLRSLEFLGAPWFYAVQGVHERMLQEFFESYLVSGSMDLQDRLARRRVKLNGEPRLADEKWVVACYLQDEKRMTPAFDRLLERLRELPLLWVVGEWANRFHVVHADLMRTDARSRHQPLWLDSDIDRWLAGENLHEVEQGRLSGRCRLFEILADPDPAPVEPRLSTTYCGRKVSGEVRSYLSHVCLDTGAYRSCEASANSNGDYGLTLHSARDPLQWRAAYNHADIVESCFLPAAGAPHSRTTHATL